MNNNDSEIFVAMPDPVEDAKKRRKSDSRAQLLKVIHGEFSSDFDLKAAKWLLDEMDKTDSDKKHRIILIIAALTLIVALLTLLVAVTDFSCTRILSSSNTNQKKQKLKPNIEPQKPASTNAVPQ